MIVGWSTIMNFFILAVGPIVVTYTGRVLKP